jgi:hypothetical protein
MPLPANVREKVEPFSQFLTITLGDLLERECLAGLEKALLWNLFALRSPFSTAHFHASWGEFPDALAEARKAYEVGPWYPDARATLAALLLKSGAEEEARRLHESIGAGQSYGDCRSPSLFFMLCGDIDKAADWAEKAIAERDCSMMHYLRFVVAKELRASPRRPRIVKMLNLPAGL